MTANKSWVNHRTRAHILMLIIIRNTVQRQLYPLPLLGGALKELIIPGIIQIWLMSSDRIEIHVFWLYSFVLLKGLL